MPSFPLRGASPLCAPQSGGTPPEASRQTWLLPPSGGRSAPPTPGDFPVAGKVTKGAPRAAAPGPCQCRTFALIGAALPLAPGLLSSTNKDRFATLSWWANRSCFFLWFRQGNTLYFQSVARQVVIVSTSCPRLHPFWGEQRLRCWGDDNTPQGEYPEGAPLWEILW